MTKLNGRKTTCVLFLLFVSTAIVSSAQTFTTLFNFDGTDGAMPSGNLLQGIDGNFYGTTYLGGSGTGCDYAYDEKGCGTVFRASPTGRLTSLYSFCSQPECQDGEAAPAGLTQATDGNLYGTAQEGGANAGGTVFKITSGGTLTTLYSFCAQPNCTDGQYPGPAATLLQAADGNLYGTTAFGGANNQGTVFKISLSGVETVIYSFCSQPSCSDGSQPSAGLIQGTDGSFYGTTAGGGVLCQCGTVFKITAAGKLTTLHRFKQYNDGAQPRTALVQASDGNFYGTTNLGGSSSDKDCRDYGCGTVFEVTPAGTETIIYNFCIQNGCADGATPSSSLTQATDGNLYGTTDQGGTGEDCPRGGGCGTAFKITLAGALTTIHTFGGTSGYYPTAGLVQDTNGSFYGVTSEGGVYPCKDLSNCGTIFSMDVGLGPFVSFLRNSAKVRQEFGILGQGFTGTTSVSLNGTPANFHVTSNTLITAVVPPGATTGYVSVTTPTGVLTSNVPFHVIP
jgi:uncharacterized repeat protein (TIGR03803 family)